MGEIPVHWWVAFAGLAIGVVYGWTVHRTNFCMMGAVADLTLAHDALRMRVWLLAIALTVLATHGLHAAGLVDIDRSVYLGSRLLWAGAVLGGVLFGFGMVIACGCGSRSLVNLGAGDLRALVSLVFLAVFANMTLHGITAVARVGLERATSIPLAAGSQGLPALVADALGLGLEPVRIALAVAVALALGAYCLKDRALRARGGYLAAAVVLAVLVAAGWLTTGVLGADEFEPTPLASLTFVRPVGDALEYLMTFTGSRIGFGASVVGGVIVGAAASSLLQGTFRLKAFEDVHDLGRYVGGGALMGVGGVAAMGCTVGQGITGIGTLSLGSLIALASIIGGAVLGVRYLEQGGLWAALRTVTGRS